MCRQLHRKGGGAITAATRYVKISLEQLEEDKWWLYGHCVHVLLFHCSEEEPVGAVTYLTLISKREL
jgi:hypothetical protein